MLLVGRRANESAKPSATLAIGEIGPIFRENRLFSAPNVASPAQRLAWWPANVRVEANFARTHKATRKANDMQTRKSLKPRFGRLPRVRLRRKLERSAPSRGDGLRLLRRKTAERTADDKAPRPVLPGDETPAARARRARRKLRRLFDEARRAANGGARLPREREYELLRAAYSKVRRWRDDGVAQEIERELRAEAEVAISAQSSAFLVLIRSALPHLDPKRASKMALALAYADQEDVPAKRLTGFLHRNGGIEGAAARRAKLHAAKRQRNASS